VTAAEMMSITQEMSMLVLTSVLVDAHYFISSIIRCRTILVHVEQYHVDDGTKNISGQFGSEDMPVVQPCAS
jgi:hypothetical protein